jgi:hypothetical protein
MLWAEGLCSHPLYHCTLCRSRTNRMPGKWNGDSRLQVARWAPIERPQEPQVRFPRNHREENCTNRQSIAWNTTLGVGAVRLSYRARVRAR